MRAQHTYHGQESTHHCGQHLIGGRHLVDGAKSQDDHEDETDKQDDLDEGRQCLNVTSIDWTRDPGHPDVADHLKEFARDSRHVFGVHEHHKVIDDPVMWNLRSDVVWELVIGLLSQLLSFESAVLLQMRWSTCLLQSVVVNKKPINWRGQPKRFPHLRVWTTKYV